MERLNNYDQNKEPNMQESVVKLVDLGSNLLKDAVVHTTVWKRTTIEVPHDRVIDIYDRVMNSDLSELISNLDGYKQKDGSDKPYDFEVFKLDHKNPTAVTLTVEEFGPYKEKYHSTSFNIIFSYGKKLDEYSLKVQLTNSVQESYRFEEPNLEVETYNEWSLSGGSYQYDLMETGYEGSGSAEVEDIKKEHFDFFHSIFSDLSKNNIIKEKTLEEQMVQVKMINADTNKVFYYDPERKDYFSEDGEPMKEDESPIENLPDKGTILKVTGEYVMSFLSDGEQNPFVKNETINTVANALNN